MMHDSADMLSKEEIAERYRALGDDMAYFGVRPRKLAPTAFEEGYRAGLARHVRPRAADRFVRKWLHMRRQALSRRRAVSQDVTLEFLRTIDVSVCPVTLVSLTHGEVAPTDWSIDRLNNNGAYGVGNIAVMSTRANSAKGERSLAEVQQLSAGSETVHGLTPREWERMAATMYGACVVGGEPGTDFIRQVAPVPPKTFGFPMQAFQDLLVRVTQKLPEEPRFLAHVLESLPNNQLRGYAKRMVRMIEERAAGLQSIYDVWLDSALFDLYKLFFGFLGESTHGNPGRALCVGETVKPISERMLSELQLKTRGYLSNAAIRAKRRRRR